jgi:hypothetical protein
MVLILNTGTFFHIKKSAFNTDEFEVSNTFQPYPNPINNGAIL